MTQLKKSKKKILLTFPLTLVPWWIVERTQKMGHEVHQCHKYIAASWILRQLSVNVVELHFISRNSSCLRDIGIWMLRVWYICYLRQSRVGRFDSSSGRCSFYYNYPCFNCQEMVFILILRKSLNDCWVVLNFENGIFLFILLIIEVTARI